MAIYEITSTCIRKLDETSFELEGIRERADLQRLLRSQIEVVSRGILIIAEEFCEWEDCKRRIDLLGVDKDANLVVIELKRSEDGGHMELQAVRYAAMVSTITFQRAVEVYGDFLRTTGQGLDAQASLLDFLGWEEPDEDRFAQDVRIILVSAEFSKELTTAVMWLNERELDIRCIRIKPYQDNGRLLIDVQQVIPLPEAAEYQVQIREKERRERTDRAERYTIRRKFWTKLLAAAEPRTDLHANISPSDYHWIATGAGMSGLGYHYVTTQHEGAAELYINREVETENKAIFDKLYACKDVIENAFGEPLEWQRLDGKRACRIRKTITLGGYRDDEQQWSTIQDGMISAMIRLEESLRPHLEKLKQSV